MKILYVLGGLPFGGIENLMFDISVELKKRGIDHKIVNLSGEGEKVREFLESGLPVINLGRSKKDIKTFKLKTALKLRRLIQEYRPNIVHTMQFSGDYFGRISSIGLPVRVVTHIQSIKVERRKERRILNKLLAVKTSCFISASKAIFQMVEKYHNIFKRPHYIIYNGVNFKKLTSQLQNSTRADLKNLDGKKTFLILSRLVKLKRIDIAIKALHLITNKYPEAVLAIVGEGKERKNLENLVKNLKLSDKVFFFGYQKQVAPFLAKGFAFLMPSEYEGLPIAHLEAAYFGLPAIISPFVPSREILSEASLISPLSETEFAKNMELILSNEMLYKKLSRNAETIARKHSIESYVDKLLFLYDSLLVNKLPKEKVL